MGMLWGESLGIPHPRDGPWPSPRRSPPGVSALLSPGHVFLLAVMETSSSTRSARAPSMPLGRRSTSTRWLSVPPGEKRRGVRTPEHPQTPPAAPFLLCSAASAPPHPPNPPARPIAAPRPSGATRPPPQLAPPVPKTALPDTRVYPRCSSACAMALAFLSTCWQYSWKAGELAWQRGHPISTGGARSPPDPSPPPPHGPV